MYPNDQNPQPQTLPPVQPQPTPAPAPTGPSSYLDQITPQQTKKFAILGRKPVLIGAIALVLLVIVLIFSNLPKSITPTTRFAARLTATNDLAEKSTSKLKSSSIRSINSNLKIYLANIIRDVTPVLAAQKVSIKKLGSAATAAESTSAITTRLEDARLNGIYDRTYAREMAYQLSTLMTIMNQVGNKTTSAKLKSILKEAKANLAPIQTQFSDYNSENS